MESQYELSLWRKDYSRNFSKETQIFAVIFVGNPWQRFKGIWGRGEKCDVDGKSVPGFETDLSANEGVIYDHQF